MVRVPHASPQTTLDRKAPHRSVPVEDRYALGLWEVDYTWILVWVSKQQETAQAHPEAGGGRKPNAP